MLGNKQKVKYNIRILSSETDHFGQVNVYYKKEGQFHEDIHYRRYRAKSSLTTSNYSSLVLEEATKCYTKQRTDKI